MSIDNTLEHARPRPKQHFAVRNGEARPKGPFIPKPPRVKSWSNDDFARAQIGKVVLVEPLVADATVLLAYLHEVDQWSYLLEDAGGRRGVMFKHAIAALHEVTAEDLKTWQEARAGIEAQKDE